MQPAGIDHVGLPNNSSRNNFRYDLAIASLHLLPMKNRPKLTPISAALLVILLIIAIWVAAYPIATRLPQNTFQEPLNSSYDALNVLFTALAFGGVIITLIFQAHEAKSARNETVERSILEMFQILTSTEFQATKNSAFRVLIAVVKNRDYGEYVASKLFAVDQLSFPGNQEVKDTLRELDSAKQTEDAQAFEHLERHDRLKLDDMMNFFSMLAQRESSKSIVNRRPCKTATSLMNPDQTWQLGMVRTPRLVCNDAQFLGVLRI